MRLIRESLDKRSQVTGAAGLAIWLECAGEHRAHAAVVCTGLNGRSRFAEIMGADADQQPPPSNASHIIDRQIILPEMHTISLGEQRDVRPIIDDQRRLPTRDLAQHARPAKQFCIIKRLLAQLDAFCPGIDNLLRQRIPCMMRAQRLGQQHTDAPLLTATCRESSTQLPFNLVPAIAQLLHLAGNMPIDDLRVLLNRAQRFAQSLASRLHNIAGRCARLF